MHNNIKYTIIHGMSYPGRVAVYNRLSDKAYLFPFKYSGIYKIQLRRNIIKTIIHESLHAACKTVNQETILGEEKIVNMLEEESYSYYEIAVEYELKEINNIK